MSEYRSSTQAEETSWSSLPVIVLCCIYIYNFDKCVADQQELKGGQYPVDPDLNIDLTYKSRTTSVIGPFLSRHVFPSAGQPSAQFLSKNNCLYIILDF